MNGVKLTVIVLVALIVGTAVGLYGSQHLKAGSANKSSIARFVIDNKTPWRADVQGVVNAVDGNTISVQLRTEDGTSKETYTFNLASRENLLVERVTIALDNTVTKANINYEDVKVGDEVALTISSSGEDDSLTVSTITLISSGASSE